MLKSVRLHLCLIVNLALFLSFIWVCLLDLVDSWDKNVTILWIKLKGGYLWRGPSVGRLVLVNSALHVLYVMSFNLLPDWVIKCIDKLEELFLGWCFFC